MMGGLFIIIVLLVIGFIGYEVLKHSDRLTSLEAEITKLKSKL